MTVSPKVQKSALNISAAIGAVAAVAALMAPAARAIDSRYVKSVTYSQDSINAFYRQQYITARMLKIDTMAANLDTIKACLRRRSDCR